jgi:hypothetical protein
MAVVAVEAAIEVKEQAGGFTYDFALGPLVLVSVFAALLFPAVDLATVLMRPSRAIKWWFVMTSLAISGLVVLTVNLQSFIAIAHDDGDRLEFSPMLWRSSFVRVGFWGVSLVFRGSFVMALLEMAWRKRKRTSFPALTFCVPEAFSVSPSLFAEAAVVRLSFDKTGCGLGPEVDDQGSLPPSPPPRPFLVFTPAAGRCAWLRPLVLSSCALSSTLVLVNLAVNFPVIEYGGESRFWDGNQGCLLPVTGPKVTALVVAKLVSCALTFLLSLAWVLTGLHAPKALSLARYARFLWRENTVFQLLTAVLLAGTVAYSFMGHRIRVDMLPPFEVLPASGRRPGHGALPANPGPAHAPRMAPEGHVHLPHSGCRASLPRVQPRESRLRKAHPPERRRQDHPPRTPTPAAQPRLRARGAVLQAPPDPLRRLAESVGLCLPHQGLPAPRARRQLGKHQPRRKPSRTRVRERVKNPENSASFRCRRGGGRRPRLPRPP